MSSFCLICKKPAVEDKNFCKEHEKFESRFSAIKEIDKDFAGISPPAVFIGSKLGYPRVNVGILTPIENTENPANFNNITEWVKQGYSIQKIIELRTSLINSRFKANVHEASSQGRMLSLSQEVAMAMKPASLEIHLEKKPIIKKAYFDDTSLPIGPAAELKSAALTENVKISNKIERVYNDRDLKAIDGLRYLNEKGFDESQLSQLLSVGILGIGKDRKLVPTRFSITAVDSNLGEDIISEIKCYEKLDGFQLFFSNYFGNYYLVLLFPEIWGYELFETYIYEKLQNPNDALNYTTDHEGYKKRTAYANQCVGGYYANRFSVLKYLQQIKKQARILVIRVTTSEYEAPLGVWVVRQGVKKTMDANSETFETRESMLSKASSIAMQKFNLNLDYFLAKSILLKEIKKQNKLSSYF